MSAVPFRKAVKSNTKFSFADQLEHLLFNHAENKVGLLTEKIEPNHPPRFATNAQIIENAENIISLMKENKLSSSRRSSWKTPYVYRQRMQDVIIQDLTILTKYNDPSFIEAHKIKQIMRAIKPITLGLRSSLKF